MRGIGATAMAAIGTFIENMKAIPIAMRIAMRSTEVSCSATNVRMRSTSVVQRWMMSPVWFFMCQAKGRREMCANSLSRMLLTKFSDALVLSIVVPYWAMARTTASPAMASAIRTRCCPR